MKHNEHAIVQRYMATPHDQKPHMMTDLALGYEVMNALKRLALPTEQQDTTTKTRIAYLGIRTTNDKDLAWRSKDLRQHTRTNRKTALKALAFGAKFCQRWVQRFAKSQRYGTHPDIIAYGMQAAGSVAKVTEQLPWAKRVTSDLCLDLTVRIGEVLVTDAQPHGSLPGSQTWIWFASLSEGSLLYLPDFDVYVELLRGDVVFLRRDVRFSTRRHVNSDHHSEQSDRPIYMWGSFAGVEEPPAQLAEEAGAELEEDAGAAAGLVRLTHWSVEEEEDEEEAEEAEEGRQRRARRE